MTTYKDGVTINSMEHEMHSIIPNITHVATKVHVILRRLVMVTWMHDNRELVQLLTLWNNTQSTLPE